MRKLKNRRIPNGTYGGVRGRRAEARLLLDGIMGKNQHCYSVLKDRVTGMGLLAAGKAGQPAVSNTVESTEWQSTVLCGANG